RDDLRSAVPAAERVDDVDLRVGEERVQVAGPRLGIAGEVVVLRVDAAAELDLVPALLPPAPTAVDLGAVLDRAGGRWNADRPAVRQGPCEHRQSIFAIT